MYTVLIADDEKELRNALVRTVDWAAIGFEIIGEAENGVEALELIDELEPDLLLTDIRMPFMTGIELAREARKLRPVMDIVFLSGYDDFEYAQQAIEYNIISYLLKPLSAAEMTQEMTNIRKKMDVKFERMKMVHEMSDYQEKKMNYDKTLFLIPLFLDGINLYTTDGEAGEEKTEQRAKELGIRKNSEAELEYIVMVTAFCEADKKNITNPNHMPFVDEIIQKYVCCNSVFSKGKIISVISDTKRNIEKFTPIFAKEIIQGSERIRQQKCEIGISNHFKSLVNANNAYVEAVTACDYAYGESSEPRFISDVENLSHYVTRPMEGLLVEFERQLQTGDEQSMGQYLDKVLYDSEIGNNEFVLMQLISTIHAVLNSVPDKDKNPEELLSELSLSERMIMNSPAPKVKENIRVYANAAMEIIANQRKQSSQLICEQALQIINKEYADENLKLSTLSQRLHISASYLSALIKRECGESFVNLLTEKRMKMAKESLLCTSKKMVEIATECGYSDHHYFSYCFKKYYGMSPNKMRESVRNG